MQRPQPEWLKKALAERSTGPSIKEQVTIIGVAPIGGKNRRGAMSMSGSTIGGEPIEAEFTGYGEDGNLQPDNPVKTVNTSDGTQMIHEGEISVTMQDGTTRVFPSSSIPQEFLKMIEKTPPINQEENEGKEMPGMCGGGKYRMIGMRMGGEYKMPGMAMGGNYKQLPQNAALYSPSTISGMPMQSSKMGVTDGQPMPSTNNSEIVATMDQERQRMTQEGATQQQINTRMTQILDTYNKNNPTYKPPMARTSLSTVAKNSNYKMPGMQEGGVYDPNKDEEGGQKVEQTQELAGLTGEQSKNIMKGYEGMVSGEASKASSLANSEAMAASAKNLRGTAANQIAAAGLTGQGAANQVMQGVNQQIAGNLTQGLLQEAQDRQATQERGAAAMQAAGQNVAANRQNQFEQAVQYGDKNLVGKTAANMFGQTIGENAAAYDIQSTQAAQRQGTKDQVAKDKFLNAVTYGDDATVRAAYKEYYGTDMGAGQTVDQIRDWARRQGEAATTTAEAGAEQAKFAAENQRWQNALMVYDPNTPEGLATLQKIYVEEFGGTAPDLNTIKSESSYAEKKRAQDVASGQIAISKAQAALDDVDWQRALTAYDPNNPAELKILQDMWVSKFGGTAPGLEEIANAKQYEQDSRDLDIRRMEMNLNTAQYDQLLKMIDNDSSLDFINSQDANGDGKPDYNISEDDWNFMRTRRSQEIEAGRIANETNNHNLIQMNHDDAGGELFDYFASHPDATWDNDATARNLMNTYYKSINGSSAPDSGFEEFANQQQAALRDPRVTTTLGAAKSDIDKLVSYGQLTAQQGNDMWDFIVSSSSGELSVSHVWKVGGKTFKSQQEAEDYATTNNLDLSSITDTWMAIDQTTGDIYGTNSASGSNTGSVATGVVADDWTAFNNSQQSIPESSRLSFEDWQKIKNKDGSNYVDYSTYLSETNNKGPIDQNIQTIIDRGGTVDSIVGDSGQSFDSGNQDLASIVGEIKSGNPSVKNNYLVSGQSGEVLKEITESNINNSSVDPNVKLTTESGNEIPVRTISGDSLNSDLAVPYEDLVSQSGKMISIGGKVYEVITTRAKPNPSGPTIFYLYEIGDDGKITNVYQHSWVSKY